jgi:hypothetical protein
MNRYLSQKTIFRNALIGVVAISLAGCGTATFTKSGSNERIESLRIFHVAFVDQFAAPGKRFNAAAFDAKVNEGNAKFQEALASEKFTARRAVLRDLANQFKADADHLRSKASRGKVTSALATEMKRDINSNYDQALGKKG